MCNSETANMLRFPKESIVRRCHKSLCHNALPPIESNLTRCAAHCVLGGLDLSRPNALISPAWPAATTACAALDLRISSRHGRPDRARLGFVVKGTDSRPFKPLLAKQVVGLDLNIRLIWCALCQLH
jgi:hypothetical protein